MPRYTCISCNVSFIDAELQRIHYKSEWHRYNLKRKVAELPPITDEEFQQKLLQQQTESEQQLKETSVFCKVCGKSFSSDNAYSNHLNSKKHNSLIDKGENQPKTSRSKKEKSKFKQGDGQGSSTGLSEKSTKQNEERDEVDIIDVENDDDEWEDIETEEIKGDLDEDESEALPPNYCLFCPHESVCFEDSLRHMTRSHSFFIPDIDYLMDLEGLIMYLGSKVGDGKVCLCCNQKSRNFYSIEAVQKHMVDKGHCKIDFEGDAALEFSEFYDFSTSYPDYDPESESSESETRYEPEGLEIDEDTMELVLPSGARAGHRAFKHYYKQNVPTDHIRKARAMIRGVGAEYRALGWHGTVSETMRNKMEAHKIQSRRDNKDQLRLKLKANKFQKFFRPQVVF